MNVDGINQIIDDKIKIIWEAKLNASLKLNIFSYNFIIFCININLAFIFIFQVMFIFVKF